MELLLQEARSILKGSFGYDQFRPQQEAVISSVLAKQDTLVLMPTGGGKSICFQIPAMMQEGLTVVISPLISLMKDQVQALKANNIAAAFYNSSLSSAEETQVIQAARSGALKLLYISPERLLNVANSWLQQVKVSMVAIDEAHCVSMWGHDFRPEYTQLKDFRNKMPNVPFVALTATADKATRNDIIEQIGLRDPQVFISSFNRPNLSLKVRSNVKKKQRIEEILNFIESRPNDAGIIYCLSRKNTDELADELKKNGIKAEAYHAGLPPKERDRIQDAFINESIPVVCATIAFGMGIDRSNVRWVIHNNLPKNLEGYYQEIGRAGRDGLPSDTILYYSLGDIRTLHKFASESQQSEILIEKLERIQQYAEAHTCRRRVLLAYFGEHLEDDCGNCDVCKDPPVLVDGTLLAQKALSALYRTREQVGSKMLIDILRGSHQQDLIAKGYDKIKTYGAGKDLSHLDWQHYMTQMLNMGAIEIAYDEGFTMKITPFGKEILLEGRTIQLSKPSAVNSIKAKVEAGGGSPEEKLFEKLRKLRLKLAQRDAVPAYVVFTDATLREMASDKPITEDAMLDIQGVSKAKYHKYGVEFIMAIEQFESRNISTFDQTWALLEEGLSPSEIAQKRGLSETTIYSHLAKFYEEGKPIDLKQYITDQQLDDVARAKAEIGDSVSMKPYYEFLGEAVPYHTIRIGVTILNKQEQD